MMQRLKAHNVYYFGHYHITYEHVKKYLILKETTKELQ